MNSTQTIEKWEDFAFAAWALLCLAVFIWYIVPVIGLAAGFGVLLLGLVFNWIRWIVWVAAMSLASVPFAVKVILVLASVNIWWTVWLRLKNIPYNR